MLQENALMETLKNKYSHIVIQNSTLASAIASDSSHLCNS